MEFSKHHYIGSRQIQDINSKFVENANYMGVAKPLDEEITHYLGHLSTEQKKVVLSVVKSFAREEESWIDNKAYIAEMNKRFKELEIQFLEHCVENSSNLYDRRKTVTTMKT